MYLWHHMQATYCAVCCYEGIKYGRYLAVVYARSYGICVERFSHYEYYVFVGRRGNLPGVQCERIEAFSFDIAQFYISAGENVFV